MTEIIEQYLTDDIELVRGGDYYETINLYEDDDVTPQDTTDVDLEVEIRKSPNGDVFDTLTTDGARIVATPGSGQYNINWLAAEIDAYEFTAAVYRMILIYPSGKRQVWRMGPIKVV